MRLYRYIGPSDIRARAGAHPAGTRITTPARLAEWIGATQQRTDAEGRIVATFVVTAEGGLLLADRASEHVQCAGEQSVQSAGEMAFTYVGDYVGDGWRVEEVSNQSTGYCPEPESWLQVAAALDAIPLAHPERFTAPYIFRRCPVCAQINLVKEGYFACAVCGADLPERWNLDADTAQ
jgi:hypothetical protein